MIARIEYQCNGCGKKADGEVSGPFAPENWSEWVAGGAEQTYVERLRHACSDDCRRSAYRRDEGDSEPHVIMATDEPQQEDYRPKRKRDALSGE